MLNITFLKINSKTDTAFRPICAYRHSRLPRSGGARGPLPDELFCGILSTARTGSCEMASTRECFNVATGDIIQWPVADRPKVSSVHLFVASSLNEVDILGCFRRHRMSIRGIHRRVLQNGHALVGGKSGGFARLRGPAAAQPKRRRARTGRTLEPGRLKSPNALAVGGPLSPYPPGRRPDAGRSQPAKRVCKRYRLLHASRIPHLVRGSRHATSHPTVNCFNTSARARCRFRARFAAWPGCGLRFRRPSRRATAAGGCPRGNPPARCGAPGPCAR